MLPICNIQLKAQKPDYRPFPEENDQSLGACLKRERITRNWTQKDVADHFNMRKDSYQNWEWNVYVPEIKSRKKVIEFLGYNYWDDGTDKLANRLRLYRIENELTQLAFSELVKISYHTLERIESGKSVNRISEKCIIDFLS